jgi:hypothetical protein
MRDGLVRVWREVIWMAVLSFNGSMASSHVSYLRFGFRIHVWFGVVADVW